MEECHCYLLTTKEILCAATLVCFNRDSDLVLSITMRLLQLWFILTWLLPWVPDCCCSHFCFWFIVAWKPNFRRIKHAELLSNSSLWIVICARISGNDPRFLGLMYVGCASTIILFVHCFAGKNENKKSSLGDNSSYDIVWYDIAGKTRFQSFFVCLTSWLSLLENFQLWTLFVSQSLVRRLNTSTADCLQLCYYVRMQ